MPLTLAFHDFLYIDIYWNVYIDMLFYIYYSILCYICHWHISMDTYIRYISMYLSIYIISYLFLCTYELLPQARQILNTFCKEWSKIWPDGIRGFSVFCRLELSTPQLLRCGRVLGLGMGAPNLKILFDFFLQIRSVRYLFDIDMGFTF